MSLGGLLDTIYSLFGNSEDESPTWSSAQHEGAPDGEKPLSSVPMSVQTSYLIEAEAARQRWARAGVLMDLDLPPQPVRQQAVDFRAHREHASLTTQ